MAIAVERLQEAQLRHAHFYQQRLFHISELYENSGQDFAGLKSQFQQHLGQLRQAQAWTAQNRHTSESIARLCSNYALIHESLYDANFSLRLRKQWLSDALYAAEYTHDDYAQAHHLIALGLTEIHMGEYDEAQTHFQTALDIGNRLDKPIIQAKALRGLAAVTLNKGDIEIGMAYTEKSYEIAQVSNDRRLLASVLFELGRGHYMQNLFESAQAYHQQSLEIYEQINDFYGIADVHHEIGSSLYSLGHYEPAEKAFLQALAMYEQLQFPRGISKSLTWLAAMGAEKGQMDLARQYGERSLEIKQRLEEPREIAMALNSLANIMERQSLFEDAHAYYSESLEICRKLDDKTGIGILLINLGSLEGLQLRIEASLPYYQDAMAVFEQSGDLWGIARAKYGLGEAHFRLKDYDAALPILQEAYDKCVTIEDPRGQTMILNYLGKIALNQGRRDQSIDLLLKSLNRSHFELGLLPNTLSLLIAFAQLFIKDAQVDIAGRLLDMVQQHPIASSAVKNEAQGLSIDHQSKDIEDLDTELDEIVALILASYASKQ